MSCRPGQKEPNVTVRNKNNPKINLNNWLEVENYLDDLDQVILKCRLLGFNRSEDSGLSGGNSNDNDDNDDGSDGGDAEANKLKIRVDKNGKEYYN